MKKVFATVLITVLAIVNLSLPIFALEEPEEISVPEIKPSDRINYYLPEISTVLDITAANADEPYSEVTVTNPITTAPETTKKGHIENEKAGPDESTTKPDSERVETTKESKKPPVELATSDKAVVAIAATILVVVVICIVALNIQKGKEEETL